MKEGTLQGLTPSWPLYSSLVLHVPSQRSLPVPARLIANRPEEHKPSEDHHKIRQSYIYTYIYIYICDVVTVTKAIAAEAEEPPQCCQAEKTEESDS